MCAKASANPWESPAAPILIVGAGPTGLVLALCLTRLGVPVRIIDKAAEAGTTSRALGVHARTLEFYRQLGISDAVVAAGIKSAGVNLWVRGSKAARVPLTNMGSGLTRFPYLLIYPQDAHERLLIATLAREGVEVERSVELVSLGQSHDSVTAHLKLADGSEQLAAVPYLAGCDGASSSVRQALTKTFPGGTYSHLFYVADVEAKGPATNKEVHIDMEDADFLGVFPLTKEGHVRLIGSVGDELQNGRGSLGFGDVRGKALRNLKVEVIKENWFSTYRVHHRVADHFREGRVFLLGDAAHVHSPVGAQGMNTGIGDAINLSWKLASVVKGEVPAAILDTYEQERRAFALRLVATTDKAFTLVTSRGFWARLLRTRIVPLMAPRLFGIPAIRRMMFRTVSQIGISYRKSALSLGSAGKIHAGDRLPWVQLKSGGDNFAQMTGLRWRVHIYGRVPAGIKGTCEELHLPLQAFPWEHSMRKRGLTQGALYLMRPDSHVAFADLRCMPDRLREYVRKSLLVPIPQPVEQPA
ncbi:MAG TPA: FAD-dependent monooxygenase [Opitutaceae bacterium]|nr:FAD-dependent monooxygenase [Opitutaceae bacterium]